jgi:hypothetical protein
MSAHFEIDETAAVAQPTRSSASERMRAHRQRRAAGLRWVTIELRETEISELVRRNLLATDARNDVNAVRNALYEHLDVSLRILKCRVTQPATTLMTGTCVQNPIYSQKGFPGLNTRFAFGLECEHRGMGRP